MGVQYQRNIGVELATCVFEICKTVKNSMLVKNSMFQK